MSGARSTLSRIACTTGTTSGRIRRDGAPILRLEETARAEGLMDERLVELQLRQQAEAIDKITKAMNEAAASAQQKEELAAQRRVVDLMTEVHGKLIDRSAAYTNLMLLGGYAGIFTIWSGTRANLPPRANVAIAVAIGVSLAVFIGFEIYKMVINGVRILKTQTFLTETIPLDQFNHRLEEFKKEEAKSPFGYVKIWITTMIICISAVLVALGLLAYNFFAFLAGIAQWPV